MQKYVHPNAYFPACVHGSTVSASTRPGGLVGVRGMFIRFASSASVSDPLRNGISSDAPAIFAAVIVCLRLSVTRNFAGGGGTIEYRSRSAVYLTNVSLLQNSERGEPTIVKYTLHQRHKTIKESLPSMLPVSKRVSDANALRICKPRNPANARRNTRLLDSITRTNDSER